MGLSQSRMNSAQTNGSYHLRAAVSIELIPATGNFAVKGECGHTLEVIGKAKWAHDSWTERIETKKRHRKRCYSCHKS